MSVPYTFASATGNINLAELDANFANVSARTANANYADIAGTAVTVSASAQPNIRSLGTLFSINVSGNVVAGGIKSDAYYYANGQPFIGSGGNGSYGNTDVENYLPTYTGSLPSLTGTIATTGLIRSATVSATGTVKSANIIATLISGASITASGNISSPQISATNLSGYNVFSIGGIISAFGNVQGGNLLTVGLVSANGSVTGGNLLSRGQISTVGRVHADGELQTNSNVVASGAGIFVGSVTASAFIGNGSQLTGIPSNATITNINANLAVTLKSNQGRYVYVSSSAPLGTQGNVGDIWYQY